MSSSADNFFQFCPRCGRPYAGRHRPGVFACSGCDFRFYQNSKPTASAFILDSRGQVLLVRRAIEPKWGWWDTPGGFLEDGEHPLPGLRREIREELGVGLRSVQLFGVHMDRYDHQGLWIHTLNFIYTAALGRGNIRPQDDVASVGWFGRKQIPWRRLGFRWLRAKLHDLLPLLR
ncbi:MAG: NUDIX hydrolase [Patescibacteria group bacterium]